MNGPMTTLRQRGSSLLLAMIVVLTITIIAIGVVRFAASEVAGATAGSRQQALASCAEAGRQLLMSRFHALGMSPTSLQALNVPMDGSGGQTLAVGGHIDTSGVQVSQVSYLPGNSFGPPQGVAGIGYRLMLIGQGGRPVKVVVHCQDHGDGTPASGRQLEVEFGVRFGL